MGQTHGGTTALIAGADKAEADLAATLLEESDLRVEHCADAAALMRRLQADPLDVVLVFVDLNRIRSEDLAGVRRSWPWIRIVATGSRHDGAAGDQPDRLLVKPWLPLDLLVAAEAARSGAELSGRRRPGRSH
jgi:CheY-like chemotaxis protein